MELLLVSHPEYLYIFIVTLLCVISISGYYNSH
jgi:hypothetical protein